MASGALVFASLDGQNALGVAHSLARPTPLTAEVGMKPMIRALVLCLAACAGLNAAAPPPKPVKQPELRSELLRRTKADQEARRAWIKWVNDNGANGARRPEQGEEGPVRGRLREGEKD